MTDYVPSTPDPEVTVLAAALIRHVITFLSAIGLLHGVYSDSMIQILAGAVLGIAMTGWSLWQKYQAARKDHAGSARSATTGNAVRAT